MNIYATVFWSNLYTAIALDHIFCVKVRCGGNKKPCESGFGTRQWAEKNSKESVSESLKDLKEAVRGSLITLDEAVNQGLTKSEENVIGNWEKGNPCQQWEKVQQHCSHNN